MSAIWSNNLSVGNRTIDSAHKDIFSLIFRIAYLIGEKNVAALKEDFNLLENSLCAYFEVEEKFARAINVDFTQHKLKHQRLLKDFQNIRSVLEASNGKWLKEDEAFFTNTWAKGFVQHIKDDGKPMKVVLETHYYDFQPD